VLVNETLARRLRPDGRVVGLPVTLPELPADVLDAGSPGFRGEILGVVADVPSFEAGRPPEPAIYLPNRQRPRWGTFFLLRTTGEPRELAPAVAAALAGVDPDLAPSGLGTLEDEIALRLRRPRFSAGIVGAFALVALLLGMAGVYGVIAYGVSLRRRELGLRVALGARPRALLGAVLGEGLRLVAAGLVLGLAGALLATRLLRDLLFGVLPADPLAFGGTALLVAASALLACIAPARRASRVDPNTALRAD
jgi:ABC-type antimicrobial peptide transport system permease subunit